MALHIHNSQYDIAYVILRIYIFIGVCVSQTKKLEVKFLFIETVKQQSNEKRKKHRARHHHFLNKIRFIFSDSFDFSIKFCMNIECKPSSI